jgi:hypothetical protein
MHIIVGHPRTIRSFVYDDLARELSAFYVSGRVIRAHRVPFWVVTKLHENAQPELFFEHSIRQDFPCEVLAGAQRRRRVH